MQPAQKLSGLFTFYLDYGYNRADIRTLKKEEIMAKKPLTDEEKKDRMKMVLAKMINNCFPEMIAHAFYHGEFLPDGQWELSISHNEPDDEIAIIEIKIKKLCPEDTQQEINLLYLCSERKFTCYISHGNKEFGYHSSQRPISGANFVPDGYMPNTMLILENEELFKSLSPFTYDETLIKK